MFYESHLEWRPDKVEAFAYRSGIISFAYFEYYTALVTHSKIEYRIHCCEQPLSYNIISVEVEICYVGRAFYLSTSYETKCKYNIVIMLKESFDWAKLWLWLSLEIVQIYLNIILFGIRVKVGVTKTLLISCNAKIKLFYGWD